MVPYGAVEDDATKVALRCIIPFFISTEHNQDLTQSHLKPADVYPFIPLGFWPAQVPV